MKDVLFLLYTPHNGFEKKKTYLYLGWEKKITISTYRAFKLFTNIASVIVSSTVIFCFLLLQFYIFIQTYIKGQSCF